MKRHVWTRRGWIHTCIVSRSCTNLRSVCNSSVTTCDPGYSCDPEANSSAGNESLESLGENKGGDEGGRSLNASSGKRSTTSVMMLTTCGKLSNGTRQ